jgi:hypothetical protein
MSVMQLVGTRNNQRAHNMTFNQLIDAMIDHYVSWREECLAVESSYQNWHRADRPDRMLAFSAYVAALDREEQAAASYRRITEQLAVA